MCYKPIPIILRNLEIRTKEHFRNLRLNHTEKWAIGSHFWNTEHEIYNSTNLLKSLNRKNEIIIWSETKYLSIHMHIILWVLKSHLKVLSLKSMYADHQTVHRWHQPASPPCVIQHFSRFELRMGETSLETIVFKVSKVP